MAVERRVMTRSRLCLRQLWAKLSGVAIYLFADFGV